MYILFIIIGIIVVLILSSIRQINEYERGILFTCGKFSKILMPGWNIVWPIVNTVSKVDIRTKAVDVPEQDAITKDNVSIRINAVIYYKVFDAAKAVIAVERFQYAVSQLAQTTMRNAVGAVSLDELLARRDKISEEICKIIDEATDPWGIKVFRVEVKNIMPPHDIREAMEKQMRAERERREVILLAEGEKKAAILKAEGIKESEILKAEAEKEAAILRAEAKKESTIKEAEGEAEAIVKINEATAKGLEMVKNVNVDKGVLTLKAYESLEKVANGQATKIIIPSEIQGLAGLAMSASEIVKEK